MICYSGASLTLLNRPSIVSNFWYLFMNLSFDLLFCSKKNSTFFKNTILKNGLIFLESTG